MELEEGNGRHGTLTRQSYTNHQHLPFSMKPYFQFSHGTNHSDGLIGQPLMIQEQVLMQKCKKCPLEFCSQINYRRHIRVHRPWLNESLNYRDSLAGFWNQMSLVEVKELMTFEDVMLQKISALSVINTLADALQGLEVCSLPEDYVVAGSALLDIIKVKPSRLPISSHELFRILDDASERTFLCAGTALSVQKYVFDEGTAKNILQLRNVVASACFLFEHQLVKAWLAHKDAEALRCQKLLMEEEEAEQRRIAKVFEQKKRKKLRQMEQKVKEQVVSVAHAPPSEASDLLSHCDPSLASLVVSSNLDHSLDVMLSQSKKLQQDVEGQLDLSCEPIALVSSQKIETQIGVKNGNKQLSTQRNRCFSTGHHLQATKSKTSHNMHKWVWTKKIHPTDRVKNFKPRALENETIHQAEENNFEVLMIGSVAVRLKSTIVNPQICCLSEAQKNCSTYQACQAISKMNCLEKPIEAVTVGSSNNQVTSMFWRPVSRGESRSISSVHKDEGVAMFKRVDNQITSGEGRPISSGETRTTSGAHKSGVAMFKRVDHQITSGEGRPISSGETKNTSMVDSGPKYSEGVATFEKVDHQIASYKGCTQSVSTGDDNPDPVLSEAIARHRNLPFCSAFVRDFLSQRWKEAISGDHVTLVLSAGPEPPACSENLWSHSTAPNEPDGHTRRVLGNASNRVDTNVQCKFRKKPQKNLKMKCIPKERALLPSNRFF